MGSLISSDYISAQRNMKEMQFLHRPPTSPWSLPRRRIGDFAGKRGNEDRTKVYANHKNWLGFICHSCEGPVLWGKFLAENLKQTQGQPNNKEKTTNLCLGFSFPICSLLNLQTWLTGQATHLFWAFSRCARCWVEHVCGVVWVIGEPCCTDGYCLVLDGNGWYWYWYWRVVWCCIVRPFYSSSGSARDNPSL